MKLWNKIHIHFFTYILFLIAFLSGLFKLIVLIFSIIIIHEIGHILIAKLFKRKITSVHILPFGGLIKMDELVSTNIYEDLIISIGGILSQLILGFIMYILNNYHIIDESFYKLFFTYNKIIMGFNLIPICPLDGYRMLKLASELFIPFKKTFTTSFIISNIIVFLLLIYSTNIIKDNLIIFVFIIYMSILEFKNRKHILNRFYLERITYDFNFKIKHIKRVDDMYKNKINIIKGIHEKEVLIYKYLCKLK